MKLINAGLKTVKEAQIGLEAGNVYYSPAAEQHIYFDRQFILKDRSPYRVQGMAVAALWDQVKDWKMEDKSEKQHLTVTATKATFTPPEGYMFDEANYGEDNDCYMSLLDGAVYQLDGRSRHALLLLKKKEPTRRTWQLKYNDMRAPIVGNTISNTVDGTLYLYTGHIGQAPVGKVYIWEEVL